MRFPARYLLPGVVLAVAASCVGERPVAPAGLPTVGGNPSLKALAVAQSVDVVIPANGGELNLFGVYTLKFPANAVCDPNAADTQAGYAAAAWDSDCTVATGDVAIRATAKWTGSKLYIDFAPALRFVPSKSVLLSTTVFAPVIQSFEAAGVMSGFPIYYTSGIDGAAIADALSDQSVKTTVNGSSGKIFRRIKHFSGYLIVYPDGTVGEPCDPNQGNPLCKWVVDDEG